MRVIEVNAGNKAKGAQLHSAVGEAMQSCSLSMQGLHKVWLLQTSSVHALFMPDRPVLVNIVYKAMMPQPEHLC